MTDRYFGKPLLKLLECYVLDAIGHLSPDRDATLTTLQPKLAQALGAEGDWRQIIAATMEFPETLPAKISEIWKAGEAKAYDLGLSVDPEEFARQFVDTNFPVDAVSAPPPQTPS
jgi:hypothetical protein